MGENIGLKVLGIDPGKNNLACSLVNERAEVLQMGYIKPLNDVRSKYIIEKTIAFKESFTAFYNSCNLNPKFDYVAIERMMHRTGTGGGGVVEIINIMIGIMLNIVDPVRTYLLPAAEWKNYYLRHYGSNSPKQLFAFPMVTRAKMKKKENKNALTEHEGDSLLIACYKLETDLGIRKFYQHVKLDRNNITN